MKKFKKFQKIKINKSRTVLNKVSKQDQFANAQINKTKRMNKGFVLVKNCSPEWVGVQVSVKAVLKDS